MTGAKRRSIAAGRLAFTLLELMVAAAMLSIVFTILFATFTSVITSAEQAQSRAELNHTARFIIRALTDDLAMASLLPNNKAGKFILIDSGHDKTQRDEIRFTGFGRRFVVPGTGASQAEVTWFAVKNENNDLSTLMRGETARFTEDEITDRNKDALDVTSALLYFDVTYSKKEKWEKNYDSNKTQKTPRVVRVEFGLEDEHGYRIERSALIPVGGAL